MNDLINEAAKALFQTTRRLVTRRSCLNQFIKVWKEDTTNNIPYLSFIHTELMRNMAFLRCSLLKLESIRLLPEKLRNSHLPNLRPKKSMTFRRHWPHILTAYAFAEKLYRSRTVPRRGTGPHHIAMTFRGSKKLKLKSSI